MNEIEIVKFHIETAVDALQTNILRYYDVLHELKRMSLFLLTETTCERPDIEKWFKDESFDICDDGFWQSMTALNRHRQGILSENAISYSCHPDLRFNNQACFQMYCHRNAGSYLSDICPRLDGSAWIYYQGACNIALQYPFIDQATAITPDFDWSTYHTWVSVSPANNPAREIRWTAPSIDYAGEGLIISVSIPVYQNDVFFGLWSIDLPMDTLYLDYINETHIPEQQNFIIDYDGNIIIHPIIKTKIDNEKGSICQEKIDYIGKGFQKIDLEQIISRKHGHMDVVLQNNRTYDVFYKTIPEIHWIYFSMFPKDRMAEVVNHKVKSALDKVKKGDYSFRLLNIPEYVKNNNLVKSFNEMAEAIEIQHQQILDAQKRIVQAEKLSAIGMLAGGIAHDFNNILSSILGFTELALSGVEKKSEIEEDLLEVYEAGKRAKELVSQILAFSRQSDEETDTVSLASIVKEVLKLIRSSTPSTIQIKHDINSNRFIQGNAIQIHQIVMNLCSNAVHSMEKYGGILEIIVKDVILSHEINMTERTLQPGKYIELAVSDTGTGIPKQDLPAIFEPYFTTKPLGEGTGMGLAMVYGIVENYGGGIKVETELSKGTTFTIYLPVAEQLMEGPAQQDKNMPKGNENVLYVDDEIPIAKMGKRMLEGLGYSVITMTNSVAALEHFRSNSMNFDIVITDMTMPNMTGDELAIELMKIRPDIPVILCTGYSKKISDESSAELGIKAFAHKPIVKTELAKTVRKVLDETKKSSS